MQFIIEYFSIDCLQPKQVVLLPVLEVFSLDQRLECPEVTKQRFYDYHITHTSEMQTVPQRQLSDPDTFQFITRLILLHDFSMSPLSGKGLNSDLDIPAEFDLCVKVESRLPEKVIWPMTQCLPVSTGCS